MIVKNCPHSLNYYTIKKNVFEQEIYLHYFFSFLFNTYRKFIDSLINFRATPEKINAH